MKHSCFVIIVAWLSVSFANGYEDPMDSEIRLKSDGDNIELYKSNGYGRNGHQMVLVFAEDSSSNQPQLLVADASCSINDESTSKAATEGTEAPIACKQGFVSLESKKCYFFIDKEESWQDALKSCQAMGATLVYPMNENENTVLVNHLKTFEGVYDWWLGASDVLKEGQWVWARSKSPIGYADWNEGEPNNAGNNENCLNINKLYGWRWNDMPCNLTSNYVCQQ